MSYVSEKKMLSNGPTELRKSVKTINVKHLQKCISSEVRVGGKCCKFICFDRTPNSQVRYKMNLRYS